MYYVYVLQSLKDKNLYYGFTSNIEKRLKEHNNGKVKTTRYRKPLKIIYFEKTDTIKAARSKERYFKSGFGRKYIKNRLKNKAP